MAVEIYRLTFEGETELLEFPYWFLILVKDFVLTVVCDQVLLDQGIIDDSWLDSFLVELDLLLLLEMLLHLLFHELAMFALHDSSLLN